MDLTTSLRLVRRWFWLIGLAAIITGTISFITTRTQVPLYSASATIEVGQFLNLANPDPSMVSMSTELAQTYAAIAKTYPILSGTINKLQLPMSTTGLSNIFRTSLTPNTTLFTITVTYTDPIVVADIANELAHELIDNSPSKITDDQKAQLATLASEIAKAQVELQNNRDEVQTIDQNLASVGPEEHDILATQKSQLTTQINAETATLTQMLTLQASLQQQGTANSLKLVEEARIPETAINASPTTNTLLAALVGAAIAGVVAFVIEYLNDSIRSPSEVMPLLNLSPIGTIAPFGKKRTYSDKLIAWAQPRSTISEAYRALRVNLMYVEGATGVRSDCRLFIVSSAGPGEGKSVTVANTAVTFAITGMRILVIDADLRRPTQHTIFNVSNSVGLSTLWAKGDYGRGDLSARYDPYMDSGPASDVVRQRVASILPHIIQKTSVPGLDVIPCGPLPSNPAELLGTVQMLELVHQLATSNQYDAIFFDTPPVLVVSDASVLANLTKSGAVLVLEAGRTRRGSAIRAVQQLQSLSIPIMGVVVNRLDPRDLDAGYGQYYYYYGYSGYGQTNTGQPTGSSTLIQK